MKYILIVLACIAASADASVSPCKKGGLGQTVLQAKIGRECIPIYCYNGWILSGVVLQKRSNNTPPVLFSTRPPTSLAVNMISYFDVKQTAVRFYCTSSSHRRVVHFIDTNPDVVSLSKQLTAISTPLVYKGDNITKLLDHNATLPDNATRTGDLLSPFASDTAAWETRSDFNGFSCDDLGVNSPINTTSRYFEIWVQTETDSVVNTCTSSPTATPSITRSNTHTATASSTMTARVTQKLPPNKPERGTWAWSSVMNAFTLALGLPSRVGLYGLNVLQLTQLVSIQECAPFPLKENARGGKWIIGFSVFEQRVPHSDSGILFSILLLAGFAFLAYTLFFLITALIVRGINLAIRITYYVSFLFALSQFIFIGLGIYSWRNILYVDSYKPDDRGIGFGYIGLAFTYSFLIIVAVVTVLRLRLLSRGDHVERPTRYVELKWTSAILGSLLPTMLWKQRDLFRAKYGTLYSCFNFKRPIYFILYWAWIFPLCLFGSILPTDCDIRLWLITSWTFVFLVIHLALWNIFLGRLTNVIAHLLHTFLFIFFLSTSIWATRTYRTETGTPYLAYKYPNQKDSLAVWIHVNLFIIHFLILLWIITGIITWICELMAGKEMHNTPIFSSVVTVQSTEVKEITSNPLELITVPAKDSVIQDKSVLQPEHIDSREQERVNYLIGPIHYQGMEYVPPNSYPLNAFRRTSPDLLMYGGRDTVRTTAGYGPYR